ncbi:MAG: UvrD-helicase domain-containing protein, partial [Bacteroidales bacterium]
SEKTEQIQQAYQEGLNRILAQSVSFYDSHIEDFKSVETIYGFIYTLGILTDIARHVNDYCKKNNLFLISDIAALLKEIIQGNDAPFVYEKTGNRFHYIMMDEFQDTSWMQWENFRPLLVNSLSENHDCMLVGDVKQSIYRWRNSDWKILAEQVNIDFGDPWIKEFHLDTNWRSRENIIRFNTVFFEKATAILESRYQDKLSEKDFGGEALRSFRGRITKAYEDIYQQIPPSGKKGGSVRIKFYDQADKDWKEQVKSKLYDSIQSVLDQGFGPDDIAILVRKTKEGREIIASLLSMEKDINDRDGRSFDIISNESLFLENSPAVQFILSVCKYLIYPWDRINSAFMLSEYRRISGSWGYTDDKDQLDFLCGEDQAFDEILRSSFPESFFRVIRYLPHLPLFEITEKIIQIFKLHSIEAEVPYIQAFQDTVIEYIRNETSDLHSFLEWWKTEGIKRTIAVSEYQNAIRVLTIHKAKGLEFPVVIIPFCYWNLDHSPQQSTVIWCSPEKKPFDALELLPVRYSPNLADTIFCKDYYSEMLHTYVDNLNLLYVAFTRAIDRLIVYAPTTGREKMTHAGDLLFDTIRNMASVETGNDQDLKAPVFSHYWQQEKREFIFGKDLKQDVKTEKSRIRSGKLKNYPSGTMKDRLRLRLHKTDYFEITDEEKKARISYGNIMHELFEHIVTRNDIDRAISKLTSQGKIQHDKAEELKMKVVEILTHPVAGEWFDEDWEVKTEAEILYGDEKVRRPDRVLIKNNRAVVIDYKFGSEEESHKQQLMGYMKNLKMMGYTEVKGYIWYVDFAKITEVLMKYES